MIYYLKITLLFFAIILSIPCIAQETEIVKTETSSDKIAEELNKLEPVTEAQYKKWLPQKVNNYKLTSHIINGEIDETPKNNMQLVYENKSKKIEIIIVDAAKDAISLEMIYFAFDMDKQFSKEKTTKQITNEPHHISKYDEEEKTAQILTIISKRFGVSAVGKNMNSDELWAFIKNLKIEKIVN